MLQLEMLLNYFKLAPNTWPENQPYCMCPYCGGFGNRDLFRTDEQCQFANDCIAFYVLTLLGHSVEEITDRDGSICTDYSPSTGQLVGAMDIAKYVEKDLETEASCDSCKLCYTVYGCFAYCPGCGSPHNSYQILEKDLIIVVKMLSCSRRPESERLLRAKRVQRSPRMLFLHSTGFGRETCRVLRAASARIPTEAENVSFQNLVQGRRSESMTCLASTSSTSVTPTEWDCSFPLLSEATPARSQHGGGRRGVPKSVHY